MKAGRGSSPARGGGGARAQRERLARRRQRERGEWWGVEKENEWGGSERSRRVESTGGRGRFGSRGASLDCGASIASGRLPSIITV
jgi:hypothetical protein